jgi:hypothetical protein
MVIKIIAQDSATAYGENKKKFVPTEANCVYPPYMVLITMTSLMIRMNTMESILFHLGTPGRFARPLPRRMFRECSSRMPNCVNGYIGALEMGAFLRYRWCF